MKKLIASVCLLGATVTSVAFSSSAFSADLGEQLKTAMSADIRSEKEVARDRNRKPIETLQFFGLKDDMRVLEILPGGGWYTKLLAPVLNDKGQLYEALGAGRLAKLKDLPGFSNMKIVDDGADISKKPGDKLYSVSDFDLGLKNLDIVFTFRNYHNFGFEGRAAINKAAFKALKSGGVYAVVDHTRRHMQSTNDENRRRIDPVLAIKEIQAAGFVLEDYATMHYRLDDELRYEVGRKSVTGNTDRFTLKFIKP